MQPTERLTLKICGKGLWAQSAQLRDLCLTLYNWYKELRRCLVLSCKITHLYKIRGPIALGETDAVVACAFLAALSLR